MKHDRIAAWTSAQLPTPPPPSFGNFVRIIGPAAILLGTSIGSGEWLIGPAAVIRYGTGLLGIVTVAVVLQTIFNTEVMRYTVSTGEPILTGFMRLGRRPRAWGLFYVVFGFLHLGWPAYAATSAAVLFAAVNGRLPIDADASSVTRYGYVTLFLALGILIFGKTVERTLERVCWTLMSVVFTFLIVVNLAFVPASVWWSTLKGFVFHRAFSGLGRLEPDRGFRSLCGGRRYHQSHVVELGARPRIRDGVDRWSDRRRRSWRSGKAQPNR